MRATLLLVVAHAAALAALCAAGGPERAEAEECECCAATVTDLELHVAELRAENLAQRKVIERQASDLDGCGERSSESVKQPLVWRAAERDHQDGWLSAATRKDTLSPPLPHVHAFRRRTLATPAPTPFIPIPSTAIPSATPSASPVPTTGDLVGVAGLDFVLSAIETLVNSFVPDGGSTIVYLLDGETSSMLGSSIAGVATNPDGMNSVFECGVPEMEVT